MTQSLYQGNESKEKRGEIDIHDFVFKVGHPNFLGTRTTSKPFHLTKHSQSSKIKGVHGQGWDFFLIQPNILGLRHLQPKPSLTLKTNPTQPVGIWLGWIESSSCIIFSSLIKKKSINCYNLHKHDLYTNSDKTTSNC